MLKKIIIIITTILLMINCVYADINDSKLVKNRYDNIYAVYDAPDRVHLYYAQKYTLNDITAYCIEPGLGIDTDTYSSTTDWSLTNLDSDTINAIRLIAYYGYDYPEHNTMKYYLATQELIWRKIANRDVYWIEGTDKDGPRINIDNEKNTIIELVNEHTKVPSFDNKTINLSLGENKIIEDTNYVLNNYEIYSSDISDVKIDDNKLVINITKPKKNAEVRLIKKNYTTKVALIYYSGNNQKLIRSGILDPVIASSKVNITMRSKIKVIKIDEVSKNTVKRKGIKFQIKNMDTNEYICNNYECTYETESDGTFTTDYLEQGNYQLEEVKQAELYGYYWNKQPLSFSINENSDIKYENNEPIIELKFANRQLTGGFSFKKVGENPIFNDGKIIYEDVLLDGVVFKLYANDDIYSADGTLIYHNKEIIKEITTENGTYSQYGMYLGKYCLEEISSVKNHIVNSNPRCFELNYKDSFHDNYVTWFQLNNYLPKGNFELTKLNISTQGPIKDVKFAIYTEDNKLFYSGITDEEGHIYLPNIPVGKYYYKEYAAPKGYAINTEKMFFEIKENGETVKSTVTNKYITGTFIFTKTDYSTNAPLSNTLIEIYNEDNELLYSERTNEEGKIVINNLPYGKYYYKEIEAPEGYMLNPETISFEIKEDNEIVNANMTNEKIPVPITGLNENYLVYGVCAFSIILGAISIIYDHQKKK